jgi:hypothetical protein
MACCKLSNSAPEGERRHASTLLQINMKKILN